MINLLLLFGSVVLIGWIAVRGARHNHKQDKLRSRFLRDEEAANNVRKREIDPELFFVADLSALPPVPEDDPHKVHRTARRTMIRFQTPMSNLELKQQYGPSQMDIIALYEENFHEYLKALTNWAAAIAEERPTDALLILEIAVALGSEFRQTYKLAADLMPDKHDKLHTLRKYAEQNHFHDEAMRASVVAYINEKLEALV
jgi:hypothetical protein